MRLEEGVKEKSTWEGEVWASKERRKTPAKRM